jgi:hypothetical protein
MEKEKLTWRTFAARGAIAEKWPVSGTPTFYVIDLQGVIRYKWVGSPGARALDAAIEKLLAEAAVEAKK